MSVWWTQCAATHAGLAAERHGELSRAIVEGLGYIIMIERKEEEEEP